MNNERQQHDHLEHATRGCLNHKNYETLSLHIFYPFFLQMFTLYFFKLFKIVV